MVYRLMGVARTSPNRIQIKNFLKKRNRISS
jgi:hypothetical protein